MKELIVNNLMFVGMGAGLFCIAWLSNMWFSLFHNVKQIKQAFDKSVLIHGILKALCIALGTSFLVLCITLIPVYCQYVGFQIPDEFIQYFNIIVVITSFISPTISYTIQAKETLEDIMKFKSNE